MLAPAAFKEHKFEAENAVSSTLNRNHLNDASANKNEAITNTLKKNTLTKTKSITKKDNSIKIQANNSKKLNNNNVNVNLSKSTQKSHSITKKSTQKSHSLNIKSTQTSHSINNKSAGKSHSFNTMSETSKSPVTIPIKPKLSKIPLRNPEKSKTVLDEIISRKGKADSTVAELLNIDLRLKRLKQRVKEKIVESSLGDDVGIFEEFFKTPILKGNKNPSDQMSASLEKKISVKTSEKVIFSPCVACGLPFVKDNTNIVRKHNSKEKKNLKKKKIIIL
jgi:hypothetical protein